MRLRWLVPPAVALAVGALLGLTGGGSRFGPVLTGVNAVGMYLLFCWVLWPRVWWASTLGLLVEMTEVSVLGQMNAAWMLREVFHHWTAAITGINTFPLFTAPAVALMCEVAYRSYKAGNMWRHRPSVTVTRTAGGASGSDAAAPDGGGAND